MDKEIIVLKDESYQIQGAIFEVYGEIGPGFLESVYQECLEKEFSLIGIPYKRQAKLQVSYKDLVLDQYFIADFICYESIIIEIKACKAIETIHRAQLLNYLKITKLPLGLLVNFSSHPKVYIERIVL